MKSSSLVLLPVFGLLGLVAFSGCATGTAAPEEETTPEDVIGSDGGSLADGAPRPPVKCTPGQCPTGFFNIDGKDGDNCGCEYQCTKRGEDDPFDTGFIDANCDGSDGMVNECVYVSVSGGADNGDGTRAKPVKTIAKAVVIAAAGTKKRPVCLSAEKYSEAVELPSGVSLYGGFDQADTTFPFRRSFKHAGQDISTTIVAPTTGPSAGTGILIPEVKEEMHVENLTIDVKIGAAQDGQSVYGIRVAGGTAQLFIRKNVFLLGNANPGAPGATGAAPTGSAPSGNTGGNGCTSCSSFGQGGNAPVCSAPGGRGGNGSNGSSNDGSPGSAGFSGASGGSGGGGTSCISSGSGGAGGPGVSGSAGFLPTIGGLGASTLGTVVNGLYLSANGSPGAAGGLGGGGGGGGGGGSSSHSWPSCNADGAGGGGSGGCGGAGGAAGGGGVGGGSSVGVLVGGASAVIEANVFTLGNGGAGGSGGAGGVGQGGGTGVGGGSGGQTAGIGGRGGNGGPGAGGSGGGGGLGDQHRHDWNGGCRRRRWRGRCGRPRWDEGHERAREGDARHRELRSGSCSKNTILQGRSRTSARRSHKPREAPPNLSPRIRPRTRSFGGELRKSSVRRRGGL